MTKVLDKRVSFGNYNLSQDYSLVAKNLKKNNKLGNSKSSGKLYKNPSTQKSQCIESYGNRMEKRFSTNSSLSSKRTKSFKRIKENEFRKLLRPIHKGKVASETKMKSGIDVTKFNIKNLIDGPITDNMLFKTLEDLNGRSNFGKQSKSDTKMASTRMNRNLTDEFPNTSGINREKYLQSIK